MLAQQKKTFPKFSLFGRRSSRSYKVSLRVTNTRINKGFTIHVVENRGSLTPAQIFSPNHKNMELDAHSHRFRKAKNALHSTPTI